LGVLLYSIGGFCLPFFLVGSLGIVASIILMILVPKVEQSGQSNDQTNDEETQPLLDQPKPSLKITNVLKVIL
jgi:predicted MFS family arabinose efflux permease